MSVVDT